MKLENQRLREEIRTALGLFESGQRALRSMCNTIKSQSKQLSELWAETKKLQVGRGAAR